MKVKICGITNKDDATWAINYGADFIGINFWKGSKRYVSTANALAWVPSLPSFASVVGVFVDAPVPDIVSAAARMNLKGVQLHGNETPDEVAALRKALAESAEVPPIIIKAIRVQGSDSLAAIAAYKGVADYVLLDAFVESAPGGTGESFNWDLAAEAKAHGLPVFLAGGLTPDNVKDAAKAAQPFAVDVASGVEKSPKRKDLEKMRDFITKAKK